MYDGVEEIDPFDVYSWGRPRLRGHGTQCHDRNLDMSASLVSREIHVFVQILDLAVIALIG
jgi:hypothetical protein